MIEVVPAILEQEPSRFSERSAIASAFASFLHIDICDGVFVPSHSVDASIIRQYPPSVPFSVHLMVADPLTVIDSWVATDVLRVIVHCSGVANVDEVLTKLREQNREVVLAVHPKTFFDDLQFIETRLAQLSGVLFVAVVPGFQGGIPDERVLQAAATFQREHPSTVVTIDGGLHRDNVSRYRRTGVTRFIVGSEIWQSRDPVASYQELRLAMQS